MAKRSFREPFKFPYVTTSVPRWSPTSTIHGTEASDYLLKPGDDATKVLNSFPVVRLQRGATYYWHDVNIDSPVTVYGNGATIKCPSVSYCLRVKTAGTKIFDCCFVSKRRKRVECDSALFDDGCFAIWLYSSSSCVISGCTFSGFNDGAICVYDPADVKSGDNIVDRCAFYGCRAGVVLTSASDGGLVSSCRFEDCQFALYAISMMGWRVRDCIFNLCRSGVFHVKRENMTMSDQSCDDKVFSGFGLISGCMFKRCEGSSWPKEVSVVDKSKLNLTAFYFDDEESVPVKISDCIFLDSAITFGRWIRRPDFVSCFAVGCMFWYTGDAAVSDYDVIINLDEDKLRCENVGLCFSACSGRSGCKASNVSESMFDDPSFVVNANELYME